LTRKPPDDRIYHWTTVASLSVLIATGLLIGRPPAIVTAPEASGSYWFGTVRFLHFAAGFVFFYAFLLRLYWMFAGNRYARWNRFLPVTPTALVRQVREAGDVIRTDVLQWQVRPMEVLGHNALAAWSYVGVFLATVFQIATGFALYAAMSGSWVAHLLAWVVPLMGGDAEVRFWHHTAMWVFIVFAVIHVYLSIFHDVVEGRGEISSMVSGVKFVDREPR
jgi:Ni/Fe-hydrogenase 1 B-type cytochrome subunit